MHKKDVNVTIEAMKQILVEHANGRGSLSIQTDAGKGIYNNIDIL